MKQNTVVEQNRITGTLKIRGDALVPDQRSLLSHIRTNVHFDRAGDSLYWA